MRRVKVRELQPVLGDHIYMALAQVLGEEAEVLFERRGRKYLIVL